MGQKPTILAVNYYREKRTYDAQARSLTYFQGGASGAAYSHLGSDGILPDNRRGDLTGVFVNISEDGLGTWATGARTHTEQHDYLEDFRKVRQHDVKTFINNVQVIQAPVWACCHPPSWSAGANNAATVDNYVLENGGYMLMALSHPIEPRHTVRTILEDIDAVDRTRDMNVEVTLQVADMRPIVT